MKVKQAPAVARGMAAASVNTLRPVHIPKITKSGKIGDRPRFSVFHLPEMVVCPPFCYHRGCAASPLQIVGTTT
jgi:hypothetical protein